MTLSITPDSARIHCHACRRPIATRVDGVIRITRKGLRVDHHSGRDVLFCFWGSSEHEGQCGAANIIEIETLIPHCVRLGPADIVIEGALREFLAERAI